MTQNKKIIRNFGFAQSTLVRENSNNIWFSAHLIVPLTASKLLTFEKTQIIFGFLLT